MLTPLDDDALCSQTTHEKQTNERSEQHSNSNTHTHGRDCNPLHSTPASQQQMSADATAAATPTTPTAEAAPTHRGRPKKQLRSKWIQLQPETATSSDPTAAASSFAAVAAPASSYSALIRLTPSLLQALMSGHLANIQFDDKDKAVSEASAQS